jgi:hypothetical protein
MVLKSHRRRRISLIKGTWRITERRGIPTGSVPAESRFQSGVGLCWGSLVLLPFGLFAIGGGPCAGPRNALGAATLLGVGVSAVLAAAYGVYGILRSISKIPGWMKFFGALSIGISLLSLLAGGSYILMGGIAMESFVRY